MVPGCGVTISVLRPGNGQDGRRKSVPYYTDLEWEQLSTEVFPKGLVKSNYRHRR